MGLVCVEIFGYQDAAARAYAVDLGMALQLTNIIRDVSADLAQGRVYRDANDKPVRMMGVVSDTTSRKQAEQEVERHRRELARSNADLAAANQELEAFNIPLPMTCGRH